MDANTARAHLAARYPDLADAPLGRMVNAVASSDLRTEWRDWAVRYGPDGAELPPVTAADAEAALVLLAEVRETLDQDEQRLIDIARDRQVTWPRIARALGLRHPQGAQQRRKRLTAPDPLFDPSRRTSVSQPAPEARTAVRPTEVATRVRAPRRTRSSGPGVDPVEDPSERAALVDALKRIPFAELGHVRAERPTTGRAIGGTFTAGQPAKRDQLRAGEARELSEVFGQARRVQRVRCQSCRGIVANWQHVLGGQQLSEAEWALRRRVWGEDADPWLGWIFEEFTGAAFRDYWDGRVELTCPNPDCGRTPIWIRLERVRAKLAASPKTETLDDLMA